MIIMKLAPGKMNLGGSFGNKFLLRKNTAQ